MKSRIFLSMILLAVSFYLTAQVTPFLTEQSVSLKDGVQTGWSFPVPGDLKEAYDDLADYCRKNSDIRLRREEDNLFLAEKVTVPKISPKRADLIGYGQAGPTYNTMTIIFRLGYDISLNSTGFPLEMNNLRFYVKSVMSYIYDQHYERRIEVLEREWNSLDKDRKNKAKEIADLEKKLKRDKNRIEKETDETKIDEIKGEMVTIQADLEKANDEHPDLKANSDQVKQELDNLRNESHQLQVSIGAL